MEQFDQLLSQGFTYFPDLIEEGLMTEILQQLEVYREDQVNCGLDVFTNGSQPVIYNPQILEPHLYARLIEDKRVSQLAESLLECPYLLSSVAASASTAQDLGRPHLDGRIPISEPVQSTHLHTMWCVDDFTPQNGSTFFGGVVIGAEQGRM
jgi:hypothetical protein